MVFLGQHLFFELTEKYSLIKKARDFLENDEEVKALLTMSEINTVNRLLFNEHGITHARIVSGTALLIHEFLERIGVEFTTLKDKTVKNIEESKLITFLSAYLHDIGNSLHRYDHERFGIVFAKDIVERILDEIFPEKIKYEKVLLRQEILQCIYSHFHELPCLTVEAGIVRIADGLDIFEGRALKPMKLGKYDIHAFSAYAIKKVDLNLENNKIKVKIFMEDPSGIFQVEQIFLKKLEKTGLEKYFEVVADIQGKLYRLYPNK